VLLNGGIAGSNAGLEESLHLYGRAGVGKSVCIERITAKLDLYYPVPGQFFFGDYKACDVVVFEEFSWEKFRVNYPQLKRLLEGKDIAVDQKCNESRRIKIEKPVIMVTNEEFIVDEAFSRRCRIIQAATPYWLEEVSLVPVIKREENWDETDQEVIEISSEEEQ
jgi:hypothetical protein